MLLQRLREYSERLELPPALYGEAPIRYVIDLSTDGDAPEITDTADASTPATKRGVRRLAPLVKRASGIRPLLLADNAEYTLGLPRDQAKAARVEDAHRAYLDLLGQCLTATGSTEVSAVARFLEQSDDLVVPEDFDRGGMITFRVDGTFVVDLPAVQAFWAAVNAPDEGRRMQCLVCGQERPVLERLQANIKGGLIPGGQTSGTAIISANAAAFESYGLPASLTAPTCSDCGERFTKALNHLLAGEDTRIRLGDGSVTTFWTRDPDSPFNPFALLSDAAPDDVKVFLESVRDGKRRRLANPDHFYAVVLSAAGGRAVVREWIDVTLPEAQDALARWFDWQTVLDVNTGEKRYFSVRALGGATVKKLSDISPPTTRSLLRFAFKGGRLPMDLMSAAVRRAQADGGPNAAHIALIKLVLLSNWPQGEPMPEEDTLVSLQTDHPNPAYQCGRLMAVLDQIQRAAIPNVKSGVVDRYFGSASASPQGVLPRLLKGARPHLNVVRQERVGTYRALDAQLDEVLAHLSAVPGEPAFPRTLTLSDQGLFLLGFHHQRADDRARARAGAERRRARAASGGATGGDDDSDDTDSGDDADE